MNEQNNIPNAENAVETQPEVETIECAVEDNETAGNVVEEAPVAEEAPAPSEPWYAKIIRSAGATAAVAVGALVIVGLTAGLSAYAGTQAGTSDRGHSRPALEQRAMPDDSRSIDGADDYGRGPGRDFDNFNRNNDGSDSGSGYGHDRDRNCPNGDCEAMA